MNKYSYNSQSQRILGDLDTPVSVYLKLRDLFPQSVLLESSDYHNCDEARSFIALDPMAQIAVGHGQCTMTFPDGRKQEQAISETYRVEQALEDFLQHFSVRGDEVQHCGLYGYTTFNAVRYFENIAVPDDTAAQHDAPDVLYILFRYVLVFDHYSNTLTLIQLCGEDETADFDLIHNSLRNTRVEGFGFRAVGEIRSTLTDEEHKANIRQGIAHCQRGDVFQIVLSRRFVQNYEGDDFKLYRILRSVNPSPYLFYFDFGGFRIFGSSPETHCRIEGQRAYIDPIAGTTQRTGEKDTDAKNAAYLREDPKENAEHVMLVDLARNDLSRNCHSVGIDFYKDMQYYSHVIHLVSRVSGQLKEGASPIKTFVDTFPAGTLSGAPKVRAMQIISELEPHNRGAYGGCIGFIGLDGSLNQAITIRTFVSRNGELWFQAGGGIVAASQEEYELQEVNNKLAALRRAITLAQEEA